MRVPLDCQRRPPFTVLFLSGERLSSGVNAVKEPGHFEVRKSSSQVTRMQFFSSKKVNDFYLVVALETQAANAVSPSK